MKIAASLFWVNGLEELRKNFQRSLLTASLLRRLSSSALPRNFSLGGTDLVSPRAKSPGACYNRKLLMKRSTPTLINYLYCAFLIAGVFANLCAAPMLAAELQPDLGSISRAAYRSHSHTLANTSRAHSHASASQQKRVRHPALDFAALPPQGFHLSAATLGQRALDRNQLILHSLVIVRPRGRAPPVCLAFSV
jgi:hypothetical protein